MQSRRLKRKLLSCRKLYGPSTSIKSSVKIDKRLGEARIIDVIRLLCLVNMLCKCLLASLKRMIVWHRLSPVSRTSQSTAVGALHRLLTFDTLVEVLWMLPSGASRALRRESVEAVFRTMRGDLGLRRQIEQNNLV